MPVDDKSDHEMASLAKPQPRDTFIKAVERFQKGLTEEQKAQFAATSLSDVKDEIQRIQHQYGPEKRLRNMKRLSKFLEAMSQIEQVVSIFLNVHEIVAFVWGPIKLGLVVASARLETLEKLLDTYVEISEVIPGLRQYDSVFESCPIVRQVLEDYLCDILQFHTKALAVFSRPSWKDVLHSTWKTFRSDFDDILKSLKRHRALLLDERLTAAIIEIQNTRKLVAHHHQDLTTVASTHHNALSGKIEEIYRELSSRLRENEEKTTRRGSKRQQEDLIAIKSSVAKRLDAPDYEVDHQTAVIHRFAGSGNGVLEDKRFLDWYRGQDAAKHILYLHGKPGAGKSIMASRIIDFLMLDSASPVLYFYFRHNDETKASMKGMLQALLVQLLYQDGSLTEFFHQKCSSISQSQLFSLPRLQDLLFEALKSQRECFLVLDGLDECGQEKSRSRDVPEAIIDWFEIQVIPACQAAGGIIRLLVCGQRDGLLDKRLSEVLSIGLDHMSSHRQDIRRFAVEKAMEIYKRFSLSSDTRDSIVNKVADASDGMFLYARVVLENLLEQGSEADLEEELNESFPTGLEEAYERVVVRILDRPPERKKLAAEKILRLVVCAARPLCWREIQSFLCISPEDGICEPKKRRVDSCKVVCGSLVEVEPCSLDPEAASESSVKIVHATAGSFLVRSGRIHLLREHTKMALFCTRYLASSPFDLNLSAQEVIEYARSGYYGWQDYATAFWHHHIKVLFASSTSGTSPCGSEIVAAVTAFITKFSIPAEDESSVNSTLLLSSRSVEDVVSKWDHDISSSQNLAQRTAFIRKVVEAMDASKLDDKQQAVFSSLHGVRRFKCTKLHCSHFAIGFQSPSNRDEHIAEHERPFKCRAEFCYARTFGFPSLSTLEAHEKHQHPSTSSTSSIALFPNPKDKSNNRDIWTACIAGDLDAVKRLIAIGVDVQEPQRTSKGGLTPVVLAARNGNFEICRLLVEQGASIFRAGYKGRPALTAIGEAVRRNDLGFFWALLSLSRDEERDGFAAEDMWPYIRAAIFSNSKEILPVLLSWYSSYPEKQSFGKMLLNAAHHKVTEAGGKEALELILNHEFPRTEPRYSKDAWYPCLTAKNAHGDTALHLSCSRGCRPVATFLFENLDKNDLRVLDKGGDTAFHHLLRYSSCDMQLFEQLLKVGGEDMLSIANERGITPLHTACEWSWDSEAAPKLRTILESGFEYLSDEGPAHICPLHDLISGFGQLEIVRKLISTGRFDIRKQDQKGWTPFSTAANSYRDQRPMMEFLLSCDPSLASIPDGPPSNLTPLAHAVDGCRGHFIFLLRLPEADGLIDDSWASFQSLSKHSLTETLLAGCLEGKRIDLAKRVLRDRKLKLGTLGSSHWNSSAVEAWSDDEILPLMFLRRVIPNIDITPEIMDKLDAEVKQFHLATKDSNDRWIQAMDEIDLSVPFSRLASFAVHDVNKELIQSLLDAGHDKAFQCIFASHLMREKRRILSLAGYNWYRDSV